jgi:hypothetical protein
MRAWFAKLRPPSMKISLWYIRLAPPTFDQVEEGQLVLERNGSCARSALLQAHRRDGAALDRAVAGRDDAAPTRHDADADDGAAAHHRLLAIVVVHVQARETADSSRKVEPAVEQTRDPLARQQLSALLEFARAWIRTRR